MLIAPENLVHVGPFVDEERLLGLTYDLTRFAGLAAQHLCQWIVTVDLVEGKDYDGLGQSCEASSQAFMTLNKHLKAVPIDVPSNAK